MSEEIGFVYIWFDTKLHRFYIGSHWGTLYDGYVCSSVWMNRAYKKRPGDFKRRILSKICDRQNLLKEEQKWLSLIPESQLGQRYYNLSKKAWGVWEYDEDKRMSVRQKMSRSLTGKKYGPTPELRKRAISEAKRGKKRPPFSEEHRKKISMAAKGRKLPPRTEAHSKAISEGHKRRINKLSNNCL